MVSFRKDQIHVRKQPLGEVMEVLFRHRFTQQRKPVGTRQNRPGGSGATVPPGILARQIQIISPVAVLECPYTVTPVGKLPRDALDSGRLSRVTEAGNRD